MLFAHRKRLANKELEKGPNKILLTVEDLVFVSAKDKMKLNKSKSVSASPVLERGILQAFLVAFGKIEQESGPNPGITPVAPTKIFLGLTEKSITLEKKPTQICGWCGQTKTEGLSF